MTLRSRLSTSTPRSAVRLARPLAATVLLGVLLLGSSMTDQVAHAQKGGGSKTPPNPVLPNVRYMLTWLDAPVGWEKAMPNSMNQFGDVAGTASNSASGNIPATYSAFAHSSMTGTFDLNALNADWWDLNAAEPTLAAGWRAEWAGGINDSGDIFGVATNANTNLPVRAFVLEDALWDAPRFLLLPTVGAGDGYGGSINNNGDAVGITNGGGIVRYRRLGDAWPVYNAIPEFVVTGCTGMRINDDGVIIASGRTSVRNTVTLTSYRQLVSGTAPAQFPGHQLWAISNGANARIGGTRDGTTGLAGGVIRLPVLGTANDAQLIYPGVTANYVRDINDDGDLCFEAFGGKVGRGALFYDAINPSTGIRYGVNGDGILPLDQLVVNQDSGWLDNNLRFDGITNRDATGLGHICGGTYLGRGFLLTPYKTAP